MLSVPHLIVIFIVALVVFGPQKLPELARNLGKIMAEFRRATGELRGTFEEHMRDLEREAQAMEQKKKLDALQAQQPSTPALPSIGQAPDAAVAESAKNGEALGSEKPADTNRAAASDAGSPIGSEAVPGTVAAAKPTARRLAEPGNTGESSPAVSPTEDDVYHP
jgi:TatA/E family protein of Tat protein translocase